MTFQFPPWAPVDPDVPPTLPDHGEGHGRIVAIVASERALAAGWAGHAAADLAQGWTAGGARVVLADAGIETPRLHDVVEIDNAEGLTDALLYGASVRRVARPVDGVGFFVVTAGTVVADPLEAFAHHRWANLARGFVDAGVTLVLFVPADEPGREAALREATDVVVLADADEDVSDLVPDPSCVRAVLGVVAEVLASHPEAARGEASPDVTGAIEVAEAPDVTEAAEAVAAADPLAEVGRRDPLETRGSDAQDRDEEILLSGGTATLAEAGEASEGSAPAAGVSEVLAEGGSGRRRAVAWLVLLLLLVVAGAVAVWQGYLEIPGLTPPRRGEGTTAGEARTPSAAASPSAPAAPSATSGVLAFSVALGAYQDAEVARARVDTLRRKDPGHLFILAPVDVSGAVYYRVLAGPATDSATAARLAGAISGATGQRPDAWVIRPTPWAFELGEMADLEAAHRRVDVLGGLDVPAYVLAVRYSDGSVRYRVYAGAYADDAEAAYLKGHLADRGLGKATLTERTGTLPE